MRDLIPVKNRYFEAFKYIFLVLIGAIWFICSIPLLIIFLPFLWIDAVALFVADIMLGSLEKY